MISALRWLSFLWALAALGVMTYCAFQWFPNAGDAKFDEMRLGFVIAAFGGTPAWVVLPIIGLFQRKSLTKMLFYPHLLLPALAGLLYLWGLLLPNGGL